MIEHDVADAQHARRFQAVDVGQEIAVVGHRQFVICETCAVF